MASWIKYGIIIWFFSSFSVSAQEVPLWTPLAKGLSYRNLNLEISGRPVSIQALRISLKHNVIKPLTSEKNKTANAFRKESGALAVINANFFDTENRPLGLIIRDQKILNPIKVISWWSVFCLNAPQASIIPSTAFKDTSCKQAVEAGPRLVVDRSIPKLKTGSSRKSAIGLDQVGRVYFIVSDHPISTSDFTQVLIQDPKKGGLGMHNVLNLDGGGSTQLSISVGDFKKEITGFTHIPVGLAVFAK